MIQILALVWWGCGSVGVGWISDGFGVIGVLLGWLLLLMLLLNLGWLLLLLLLNRLLDN